MVSAEEDCFINCPFCLESISVRIDLTAGQNQEYSYDCEVCCRPILLKIEIDENDLLSVSVDREY